MIIDYYALKNWQFPVIEQAYTERDTLLYALGLGLGAEPLNEQRLRFVYEKDLLGLPTMAGVLGYPGFWLSEPALGLAPSCLVHGEQAMTFYRLLPVSGTVVGVNRVKAVVDKGRGHGALVVTERTLTDKMSGALLATLLHTAFVRGAGGFSESGQPSDSPLSSKPKPPIKAGDWAVDFATRPEAALIYRLSGDRAPLHADPSMAQAAGYPQPILHGMATFGIAGYAILSTCCDNDPSRLSAISGRFSAPVFPGETLRTEIWLGDRVAKSQGVMFRVRVLERDVIVLNNGFADVVAARI